MKNTPKLQESLDAAVNRMTFTTRVLSALPPHTLKAPCANAPLLGESI